MASPDLQASLRQHQAGNLDAAIAGYRAFLQLEPQHAEANRLLGLANNRCKINVLAALTNLSQAQRQLLTTG